MSIYDYTASIVLVFDRKIATETISTAGWTIRGNEPYASPGGPLVETTYSIKRIDKLSDTELKIWLNLSGRMKYPQGDVTIQYSKTLGNLQGQYGSVVEDFTITFTPTGITPVFNPADIEHLTVTPGIQVTVSEINYINRKSADEHLTVTAGGFTVVVTKVGDLPL